MCVCMVRMYICMVMVIIYTTARIDLNGAMKSYNNAPAYDHVMLKAAHMGTDRQTVA